MADDLPAMTTRAHNPHSTTDVLWYVLSRADQAYPSTWLLKLLYLADCEAEQWLGHPITDMAYVFHHYGPFDDRVYTCLDELESNGKVTLENKSGATNRGEVWEGTYYRVKRKLRTSSLCDAERAVIDALMERYRGRAASQLTQDAYKTTPMPIAQKRGRGSKVDPKSGRNVERRRHAGLDVAAVLRAREQAKRGEVFALADVERELQRRSDRRR